VPRSGRLSFSPDRVAAAGAVLALAGIVLLPLVTLRPNRLVNGVASYLWSPAVGPVAWLLPLVAVAALAVSMVATESLRSWKGIALQGCMAVMLVVLAWVLGATAARMVAPDVSGYARVSVGAGSWLYITGAAVVSFAAGKRSYDGGNARTAIGIAALLGVGAALVWGGLSHLSIVVEYQAQTALFWNCTLQHIGLALSGLAAGAAIGIPLGILSARNPAVRAVALSITGIIQTFPSLALLGLLIVPLATLSATYPLLRALGVQGIGAAPAIIALTLYALLPIVRNTYVGLAGVDPASVDAGRGMGMSGAQLLWRVELPLALPLILEGLRAAAVLVIGIVVVCALVGAGGLGVIIFLGLGQQADDLIVLGALPVILLAVSADALVRGVGAVAVSPGMRREAS
jgi:osmoprotectant transport system permease protein